MRSKGIILKSALIYVFLLGVGGFFVFSLEKIRAGEVRTAAALIANSHALSLEKQLSRSLSATLTLAALLKQNKSIPNFEAVAEDLINQYGGISNLQLAPNAIVRQIHPIKGHEPAIGHDLKQNPSAIAAIKTRQLVLEGPFNLLQGGNAVIGRYPVYLSNANNGEEQFWGFATVLIELSKLLEAVDVNGLISKNYNFELSRVDPQTDNKVVFSKSGDDQLENPVSIAINIPKGKWFLSVEPKSGWHSMIALTFELVLVLITSGTLALWSYFNFRQTEDLVFANKNMIREINQRKKVEDELNRSNQALNEFALIASHDLQEPLRKIIAFGDRLKEKTENLDEVSCDYINRMQKSTLRMKVLLDDLLSYSKVTAQPKLFKQVGLNSIVKEAISNLEDKITQTKGIIDVGDLPSIQADSSQIYQLFQNLIGNALKYHKAGASPVVNIQSQHSGNDIIIIVEDNGIGFDEKQAQKIFQPFQRLHGKSEYEGTGMGLAICNKIVDQHNGSISAKSTFGEGSKFIVTLPKKQETIIES